MIKKTKVPGRTKMVCGSCSKEFSTHSTNRNQCYTCKPKCSEKHYFTDLLKSRKEKAKRLENNEA